VQTVGYLIAAIAPFATGAVHDISGSWTPALFVLLALLVPQSIVGLEAARDRRVVPAGAGGVAALDRA
jgi:MFS transporter, CP family, cyanate transporter